MHPKIARFIVGLLVAFGSAAPALAVDELGLFELDGNAVASGDPGDDWEDLYADGANNGGSADTFTGVDSDPAPLTIFDGGKKDIQDISAWSHKSGAVPDKDDITNAYAAAYTDDGDLIVYFGADRITNVGDAFLGFWFFKNEISANPDGSFSGVHAVGDVLILANFPQATNAQPDIQVVKWDPTCKKAQDNTPNVGECVAANLKLVFGGAGANAVCSTAVNPQLACAITNAEGGPNDPTDAPWPYEFKDGTPDEFPHETFFEGGANLTDLLGGDACFASFMAETRSSSSFTASLKDFRLDSFPVCAISVTKACDNPRLNAAQTHIIYDISGTVTNDGFGSVFNVNVTDAPAFDAGSLEFDANPSSLAGGASIGYDATITVPLADNGPTDTVTATANTNANNTGTTLSDTDTATCPVLQVNPAASVTKDCNSIIDVVGSTVVAKVEVRGTVCNTGDSALTNVSVTDDEAGVLLSNQTLVKPADPANPGDTVGACKDYTGTYTPDEANDINDDPITDDPIDPSDVWFHDTVTVSAKDVFGQFLSPAPTASAQCPLCPQCEDCEETP